MTKKNLPEWINKDYSSKDRAKNYAAVIYPDDIPKNWKEILAETQLNIVISPIHDKDTNPDGEIKKAHHHLLLNSGKSWITMNQLKKLGEQLKGMAIPQKCSNPQGMVRYFTHIDNPEKYQYNQSDIEIIGRYDISEFFKPTVGEDRETRREIATYIIENNVSELVDLVEFSMFNNERWDDYIARNTIYFNSLIKSVRHRPRSSEIKE